MADPRIWNLRLNLNEFNSLVCGLFLDSDRALVLQGLLLGFNGGECPLSSPSVCQSAWRLGRNALDEAIDYKSGKSRGGIKSAESRKERYGTPQPQKPSRTALEQKLEQKLELCSNIVRENVEHSSVSVREMGVLNNEIALEDPSNQSSILNPLTTIPNSQSPKELLPSPPAQEARKAQEERKAKPLKAPPKPSWAIQFPPDVLEAVATFRDIWPDPKRGHEQPKDHQLVPTPSWPKLAERLSEIKSEGAEMEILITAGMRHVSEWKNLGTWIKAPQYFFGKSEDAPWRAFYRAELTNRKLEEQP